MGAPKTDYIDPVYGALIEAIHAQSALNMPPRPVENPEVKPEGSLAYLTETDEWVRHAYEHLAHVVMLLSKAVEERKI